MAPVPPAPSVNVVNHVGCTTGDAALAKVKATGETSRAGHRWQERVPTSSILLAPSVAYPGEKESCKSASKQMNSAAGVSHAMASIVQVALYVLATRRKTARLRANESNGRYVAFKSQKKLRKINRYAPTGWNVLCFCEVLMSRS